MRCLKLSSLLPVLALCFASSCGTIYHELHKGGGVNPSALRFRPKAAKALYRCVVDGGFLFKKYHLSGLLLMKKIPDGTTRIVFQNEMGYTFFDFEWSKTNSFSVKQIIPQMDKPALVKTFRKDMEMLMMNTWDAKDEVFFTKGTALYHRFPLTSGYAWYIENDGTLQTIENTGRKKVVSIQLSANAQTTLADSMLIRHHKAHFIISLKKIEQHAE